MSHSSEQMRKKAEARMESMHHMHHSAVDGKHDDMQRHEYMYKMREQGGDEAAKYRAEAAHEQEAERRKVYSHKGL